MTRYIIPIERSACTERSQHLFTKCTYIPMIFLV